MRELLNRLSSEVKDLGQFVEAITPADKPAESNTFFVDGIEVEKAVHLPYLKIAQGTRFGVSGLTGNYVLRVENATEGCVDVNGTPYINLGNQVKAIVVGAARAKMYVNKDEGRAIRFIPYDRETVIPEGWQKNLITVIYLALYIPGKGIAIVEGVRSKRRITDAVMEKLGQKPAFYEIKLATKLERAEKGEFIAPEVVEIKEVKANETLEKLRQFAHEYFLYRLESSKNMLRRITGVVPVTEEEEEVIENTPQEVQTKLTQNTVQTNDDAIDTDEDDIPF